MRENFRLQLFDESKLKIVNNKWQINNCAGNNLLKNINMLNTSVSKEKVKMLVNNIIDTYYDFVGYIKFANIITKESNIDNLTTGKKYSIKQKNILIKNKLQKYFGERLIIIDEIHNIRYSDDNSNKLVATELHKLVTNVDNMKLILMSATPIFNDYKEIIFLINILNLNDKRSTIEVDDVFNKDGSFKVTVDGVEIGKQLLIRKLNGYISYVKGDNPFIFPYRILPNDFDVVKSIKNLTKYPELDINSNGFSSKIEIFDIYLNEISIYQNRVYNYVVSKSNPKELESYKYTAFLKPLEALNIVYPNKELLELEEVEDDDFEKIKISIEKLVSGDGLNNYMTYSENAKSKYNYNFINSKSKAENIFLIENIENYSKKIHTILKCIENSKGPIIIYSQFIEGGLIPMALALEANGFTRYGYDGTSGTNKVNNLFAPEIFNNISKLDLITNNRISSKQKMENAKFATYTIICGDNKLTQNSEEDIKACTNINNSNGEIVKVILLSSAGSEGIDFKFIRQIHILEPWYNINRIEQIIGRGVRTCSHKDLPFKQRNVQIYMHGSLLKNKNIESIDLYMYRKCEYKIKQIGKITRLMKEISVDCFLNSSLKNFSQENIKEILKEGVIIELSNSKQINYNPGDKPDSAICDYMDNCDYKCVNDEIYDSTIDEKTYNEDHYNVHLAKIYSIIEDLFKEKYFYTKLDIIQFLSKDSKYTFNTINFALDNIIKDSSMIIKDKYNNKGYLINIDDLYIFQPLLLNNKNSSLYTKTHPIRYNNPHIKYKVPEVIETNILNKKINLDKSKIKILDETVDKGKPGVDDVDTDNDDSKYNLDDVMLTARDNNNVIFRNIVEELENILNPSSVYIQSFEGPNEKIKHLTELFSHFKKNNINILNFGDEKLGTFNIGSKDINYLTLNILLDTLNFISTKNLIEFIYDLDEEFIFKEVIDLEVLEIIKEYYNERIIESSNKNIRAFIFNNELLPDIYKNSKTDNKYNYVLFILNSNNKLEKASPMDYNDLHPIILDKYNITTKNYSNILGFIKVSDKNTSNKYRNEYDFKIKTKNSDKNIFNSGRTCKTFEKGLLIEYYKLLTGTDPPPPKEVKISSNSNCILIELLLRYLHKKNKDNIHWFSNTNEALINNYK